MRRSLPVAFQYPVDVARLVRDPLGYLRSRGQKKNHSRSRFGRNDFAGNSHGSDL
uniref:NAC010 n=1 Tax=Arundo donax TaxID=35708 RepID=A0A0A9E9V5_ARUDO